jgi:hypothetical protein
MSSTTLPCPKCSDGELTWEWWSATWDEPSGSDYNQTCECEFSDEELEKLENDASEDSAQQEAAFAEDEARYYAEQICKICGCDKSEHNWEIHAAEMRASANDDSH